MNKNRQLKLLVIILCLCAVTRIVAVIITGEQLRNPDAKDYLAFARNVVEGNGYAHGTDPQVSYYENPRLSSFRPPLYPFLLALILWAGGTVFTVKLVHVTFAVLTCYVLYAAASLIYDNVTGLVAAALYTVYVPFIYYLTDVGTETLYAFLVSIVIFLLYRIVNGHNRDASYVAAGLMMGLTVLCRPSFLFFIPFACIWLFLREKSWKWILMPCCVIMVMMPWTHRNYRVHGKAVLVSTNGGFNFWRGSLPGEQLHPPPIWELMDTYVPPQDRKTFKQLNEVEQDTYFYMLGLNVITEDPAGYIIRVLKKTLVFWKPFPDPGFHGWVIFMGGTAFTCGIYLIALGGILHTQRRWYNTGLLFLLFLSITVVHGVYLNNVRLRFPVIDPYLLIFAAYQIGIIMFAPRPERHI